MNKLSLVAIALDLVFLSACGVGSNKIDDLAQGNSNSAKGSVDSDGCNSTNSPFCGGAGRAIGYITSNCFTAGEMKGDSSVGGIVGEVNQGPDLSNNQISAQIIDNKDFVPTFGKRVEK